MKWERRAAIARRLGARVRTLSPVVLEGRIVPRYTVTCATNEDAIGLYDAWAHDAATNDPETRDVALALARQAEPFPEDGRARELGRLIQSYVQSRMFFQMEEIETSYAASVALEMGEGDCDDHASLVVALATAAGLEAHVHGVRDGSGQITHAAPTITVNGVPEWAETTLPAHFGEHPFDAAVRLGVLASRPDIGR